MLLGFIDSVVDRNIDEAIVRAIEESQFKRLAVSDISEEIKFFDGITAHLEGMKTRGLIMFIGNGPIKMDTEVALTCR